MQNRKSLACSYLVATLVSVSVAAAQNAPRREPDVPFVPTTDDAVAAMLKLGNVHRGDVMYDLGCGDGRLVIAAAKLGARATGIDINPVRIAEAKENAKKAGMENQVRFIEGDLFEADIHDANVVTLFLLSSVNMKLRPKLQADLKPGTRIVSNTFDMGDWKPDKEVTVGDENESSYLSHRLFLWIIPEKK
jgi:SAM-dependent methyltransferase